MILDDSIQNHRDLDDVQLTAVRSNCFEYMLRGRFMLKSDAAEPWRGAITARRAAILFGGLGLVSGGLSTQISELFATDLWPSPLTGVAFGIAVCLALYLTVRPKWLLLAIAFLAVQLAWRAAIETAISVEDAMRQSSPLNVSQLLDSVMAQAPELSNSGTLAQAKPFSRLDRNMLLPGLIAGAVGAIGTWLGAAFCAVGLRRPAAFALTVATGAITGLFLAVDLSVLFPVWQTAVAASIGLMILPPRDAGGA
jgi:hypothetical protein